MGKPLSVLILFGVFLVPLYAEEDFQRYDLEREANKLTLEGLLNYSVLPVANYYAYLLQPQISIGYTMKQHEFRVKMPVSFMLYNNPELEKQVYSGFEDISLSYEYLKQIQHINLFCGGYWSIPLPQSDDDLFTFGSGRHNIGLKFAITGIKDPVVWNAGIQYGIGLPSKGSWQPGNIQVNAGLTTLFNETFGVSFNVIQNVGLPQINDGDIKAEDLHTSFIFQPEIVILGEKWYARVGVNVYGHPVGMPSTISLSYGYAFEIPKQKTTPTR